MLFMIMNSDINKLICILFVHLSSIILENFKDRALIILELFEFIELHTYKFGLVYIQVSVVRPSSTFSNDFSSEAVRPILFIFHI